MTMLVLMRSRVLQLLVGYVVDLVSWGPSFRSFFVVDGFYFLLFIVIANNCNTNASLGADAVSLRRWTCYWGTQPGR
jgi:hypothetical protein